MGYVSCMSTSGEGQPHSIACRYVCLNRNISCYDVRQSVLCTASGDIPIIPQLVLNLVNWWNSPCCFHGALCVVNEMWVDSRRGTYACTNTQEGTMRGSFNSLGEEQASRVAACGLGMSINFHYCTCIGNEVLCLYSVWLWLSGFSKLLSDKW